MNNVLLIGSVQNNVEIEILETGKKATVSIEIADNSEQKEIVSFEINGKFAESIVQYLKKDKLIHVEGCIVQNNDRQYIKAKKIVLL